MAGWRAVLDSQATATIRWGSQRSVESDTTGTILIFFHPFGIKMLAVPGVSVLKCHPYRQIPIVIHGFLPEASSFSFYPNCPEQLAHLRAPRAWVCKHVNGQLLLL